MLLYKKDIFDIEREIKMKIYESFSENETKNIALSLAKKAKAGEIYCLNGDLGVGKTIFTKGFAEGLGIDPKEVTSPTFTIVNEYAGDMPFYHFDVYRIGSLEEMEYTGYEEYFFGKGVCIVEWAELIKELLPKEVYCITIQKDYTKSENYRKIIVEGGEV